MSETLTPESNPRRRRASRAFLRRGGVGIGALVAVAAAVGFIVWLTIGGSDKETSVKGQDTPVPVSISGLHTLAKAVPGLIYWAGPKPGVTYELTKTSSGRVFIRYLPQGVKIGADKPYLTIATYPVWDAFAATGRAARQPGAVSVRVGAGATAFYNRSRPKSVYFAQSGSNYQVEVFDPSPQRARRLVASRQVKAVAGGASTNPQAPIVAAVSAKGLRRLTTALGHPIYWAGPKPGDSYELTRTESGRVFIRYLPRGVKVGSKRPYLTVATYPFPGAFAAINAMARRNAIKLADGGVAVVDSQNPRSIHLAYRGLSYQIEVFDPSPARARRVVVSGQVKPVGG